MVEGLPVCCAPSGDRCGEGVLWQQEEEAVYWTDINRFLIHRYELSTEAVKSWFFEEPVTAVLLTDKVGKLAVCLGSGVILWEPLSDSRTPQGFNLPNWPAVRLNDAAVDPRGSLLVGSMRNNVNPDGSESRAGGKDGILFRIEPDGTFSECERGIGISNTLAWSPDKSRFYFGDSLSNVIWSYEYKGVSGAITGRRVHFEGFGRGLPDGSAIDERGYLWNCRYGGACIVRVSPGGDIEQVIEMPTKNITNCTFGGKDLNLLYVTTAANPEDKSDRLAGSLFRLETKTRGLPENRFIIAAG